jgi:hypothetical protein
MWACVAIDRVKMIHKSIENGFLGQKVKACIVKLYLKGNIVGGWKLLTMLNVSYTILAKILGRYSDT